MQDEAIQREILRPLWKVHILYHAQEGPIVAHWMLEELREHGYRVSPGTLYPLLARMKTLGWLKSSNKPGSRSRKEGSLYRITPSGRRALKEVRAKLGELIREVCD